jgi:geranylgeranyl diphosphate synthase type II
MLGLEKSQAELSDLIARGKVAIKDIDNQLLSDFFDLYRKAL